MAITLLNIHKAVVLLFLLIYVVKTTLLLANKHEGLVRFAKAIKVPEMIISTLFLVTGIWLLFITADVSSLQIFKLIAVFASIPLAIIGFKKHNKALAVISLLLIIGAYGLAEVNSKRKTRPQELKSETVNGNELYTKLSCSGCHGKNGQAGLNGATDLSKSLLSAEESANVIRNGRNTMPANPHLSEEQINALVTYVQGLKK